MACSGLCGCRRCLDKWAWGACSGTETPAQAPGAPCPACGAGTLNATVVVNSTLYSHTLKEGDLVAIPPGKMHPYSRACEGGLPRGAAVARRRGEEAAGHPPGTPPNARLAPLPAAPPRPAPQASCTGFPTPAAAMPSC